MFCSGIGVSEVVGEKTRLEKAVFQPLCPFDQHLRQRLPPLENILCHFRLLPRDIGELHLYVCKSPYHSLLYWSRLLGSNITDRCQGITNLPNSEGENLLTPASIAASIMFFCNRTMELGSGMARNDKTVSMSEKACMREALLS